MVYKIMARVIKDVFQSNLTDLIYKYIERVFGFVQISVSLSVYARVYVRLCINI